MISSTPAVSVVVPFFDTQKAFFEEAIASVEAQTFGDWEIILVNDGSGPHATALASRFVERAPNRIRCVSHADGRNRGIPASRNLGAEHARGAYIAFIDSDDVWLPAKLEEQVQVLASDPDAWMVFGRSVFWQSWSGDPAARDVVPRLGVRSGTRLAPPAFVRYFLRRRVLVPCPSDVLVRAESLRAVGGFEDTLPNTFEDQGFYVKIGLMGPVVAVDTVWDRYRIHPGSVLQAAGRTQHRRDRRLFLDWALRHLKDSGVRAPDLGRTIRADRLAASVPGGPRVMRSIRRALALPYRLRARLS